MYDERLYIHSEIQVPPQYGYLAQQLNKVMSQIIAAASTPTTDPFYITSVYNKWVAQIPDLPGGFSLKVVSFTVI